MPLASRIKSTGERFLPPATRERRAAERQEVAAQAAEERRLTKIADAARNCARPIPPWVPLF